MDDRFAGKTTPVSMPSPPRTDGSRLCQLATAASSLARASHTVEDHRAAADAHRKAFAAMKAADRPSAANQHLRNLTEHDIIATEPESYERKREDAYRADDAADGSMTSASHRAAAKAHLAAAEAGEKKWGKAKGDGYGNGERWEIGDHKRRAKDYTAQADALDDALARASTDAPAKE